MTNESKYKTFCKSPKAELLTPWVLPSEPLGIHPWHFIFPELSLQFQQNPWVTSKGANSPIPFPRLLFIQEGKVGISISPPGRQRPPPVERCKQTLFKMPAIAAHPSFSIRFSTKTKPSTQSCTKIWSFILERFFRDWWLVDHFKSRVWDFFRIGSNVAPISTSKSPKVILYPVL